MKTEEIVTSDFAQFGSRERGMAKDLLEAWEKQGLPKDFDDDQVTISMNKNSGYVFLTNSDYDVAMLTDDDKLQTWYNCPECGHEGFLEDMEHDGTSECEEFVKEIKERVS